MIGYDDAFAWISIVAVVIGTVEMVTWWPAGKKALLGHITRATATALGVCLSGFGLIVSRMFSLAYRAFHFPWMEPWLILGVATECVASLVIVAAYFLRAANPDLAPIHYRGIWWGLAALVALSVVWWVRA